MPFAAPIALLFALHAASAPPAPRHRAKGQLAGLISNEDYPLDALRKNEQGEVVVALAVDPTGRVSACTVTASSGSASLDGKTCSVLEERARFTPARDAKGRAVADTVTQKFNWRIAPADPASDAAASAYLACAAQAAKALASGPIPNETLIDRALGSCPEQERSLLATRAERQLGSGPSSAEAARRGFRPILQEMVLMLRPPAVRAKPASGAAGFADLISNDDYPPEALRQDEQGTVGVWLTVDPAGRATGCTVTESSGSASLDAGTCSLLEQRARFTPARDASGRVVSDIFVKRVTWRIAGDQEAGADRGSPAALQHWMRCLGTEARRLATGGGTVDSIGDRAFSACSADEGAATEAIGETAPAGGAKALPRGLRDDVRRMIVQMVKGIRTSGGG